MYKMWQKKHVVFIRKGDRVQAFRFDKISSATAFRLKLKRGITKVREYNINGNR